MDWDRENVRKDNGEGKQTVYCNKQTRQTHTTAANQTRSMHVPHALK